MNDVAESFDWGVPEIIEYVMRSRAILPQLTRCDVSRLRVQITRDTLKRLQAEERCFYVDTSPERRAGWYPAQVARLCGLPVFLKEMDTPAIVEAITPGLPLDHGLEAPS